MGSLDKLPAFLLAMALPFPHASQADVPTNTDRASSGVTTVQSFAFNDYADRASPGAVPAKRDPAPGWASTGPGLPDPATDP